MKNENVCTGCKYLIKNECSPNFKNLCNYSGATGHSRLSVERQNGGYKEDSCPCYDPKKTKRKCILP